MTNNNYTYALGFCTWTGIICASGRPVQIDLSGYSIQGTLLITSFGFGLMEGLTKLDLAFNLLSGNITALATTLTHLVYIDLSSNKFTGSITSATFDKMDKLQYLQLSNNFLTGTIPTSLAKLNTSLSFLSLSGNKFVGQVPAELCTLASARIDLSRNPQLACYSSCWTTVSAAFTKRYLNFGTMGQCIPTQEPTAMPSQPTAGPTSLSNSRSDINNELSAKSVRNTILIAVFGFVFICALLAVVYMYYVLKRNAVVTDSDGDGDGDKALLPNVASKLERLPIHQAITARADSALVMQSIGEHLDTIFALDYAGKSALDLAVRCITYHI
jgi:hypothetical protein